MPILGLHTIAADLVRTLRLTGGGPSLTISSACATGLHAIIRAAMLLESGECDRALVVAAESSLHPLFIHSYRRLGVLASADVLIRPFDRERSGFWVSEAAAAVCLERGAPRTGDIVVERYACAADAFHLTGSDPDAGALRRCLATVIDGRGVDLIHAHGTGTPLNDAIELAAIEFAAAAPTSEYPPIVYSHKGALGHSLGAAGLVAVVINCMAHEAGRVPPNVNTTRPIATTGVTIRRSSVERAIHRSLAIAAGFGGPTAVVSLVRQE